MKDTYKLLLGIDPGKGGGLAVYNEEENETKAIKFMDDLCELSAIVGGMVQGFKADEVYVIVEHVHSFPTDSRPAAFSFGRNLGQWEGIIANHELEIKTVAPRTWQEHYDVPVIKDKYERKRWLKEIAQTMFPDIKVTLAISDALLIVNYAKDDCPTNQLVSWAPAKLKPPPDWVD